MTKVKALQDNSSHWYVIPADLDERFEQLEQEADRSDDYELFEATFGKYRTGGDLNLVTLYAEL